MKRFGWCMKWVAGVDKRDELLQVLLAYMSSAESAPGFECSIVGLSVADAETIWVTEVWRSQLHHDEWANLNATRDVVARAKELAVSVEKEQMMPVATKRTAAPQPVSKPAYPPSTPFIDM
jgi:heme-degrading monooxygenase HmoA